MNLRFFKIITPFRVITILLFIFTIIQYIDTKEKINNETLDGFSGLGFVITGIATLVFFIVDLITSYFFKSKKTWIIQIVLFILLIIWFTIFK